MINALAVAVALSGQEPAPPRADALAGLMACRAITADADRLVCLDRETAALAASRVVGEVIVIDRDEAEATRLRLFGFQLPSVTGLFGSNEPDQIDRIEGVLVSAGRGGDGRWVFRLEDGAVWRQIDGDAAQFTVRPGQAVRIRRAALGSYQLLTGGSRAIRVRRQ